MFMRRSAVKKCMKLFMTGMEKEVVLYLSDVIGYISESLSLFFSFIKIHDFSERSSHLRDLQ